MWSLLAMWMMLEVWFVSLVVGCPLFAYEVFGSFLWGLRTRLSQYEMALLKKLNVVWLVGRRFICQRGSRLTLIKRTLSNLHTY
jgi:hypothetical protein